MRARMVMAAMWMVGCGGESLPGQDGECAVPAKAHYDVKWTLLRGDCLDFDPISSASFTNGAFDGIQSSTSADHCSVVATSANERFAIDWRHDWARGDGLYRVTRNWESCIYFLEYTRR